MKMICFCHAGGLSYYYTFLQKAQLYGIGDVILYEYPGRASKTQVPHYKDFASGAQSIAEELQHSILSGEDYILFGHSFGAFMAYETANLLMQNYQNPPRLVIISGQKPPCTVDPEHYRCCEKEGAEFLRKLGGIPEHLWEYPEALRYFTELCRADLRVLQTYAPSADYPEQKLPAGIVLYGNADIEFRPAELVHWNGYFETLYAIKEFKGTHFYLNEKKKEVLSWLNGFLNEMLCQTPVTTKEVY